MASVCHILGIISNVPKQVYNKGIMLIHDSVYGDTDITESVLLDLMQTPSIQRLKDVSQYGVPDKYFNYKNFNRYEHGVGVMLLLRRLGASLEEQVAGLLHDVSIFAFSHIADMVFGQARQGVESYHDLLHDKFIHQSEIPTILSSYGFSEERVSDLANFSLLEKEIPDVCADRVDYALREFHHRLDPSLIPQSITGLVNHNGDMVFTDVRSAFAFSNGFLRLQSGFWGSEDNVRRGDLFSRVVKRALDLGLIKEQDFYGTEQMILEKIEKSNDDVIVRGLRVLSDPTFPYESHGEAFFKKFRHVDPKVMVYNELKRLSELDSEFAHALSEAREINKKGVIV